MDEDNLTILAALANVSEGQGLSLYKLSDECNFEHGYVRELIEYLEGRCWLKVSGGGMSAVAIIQWTGRKALEAGLSAAHGSVNVHGGVVQVGSHNTQAFADDDVDEDDGGEDDEEDDDEEDIGEDEDGDDEEDDDDDDDE